MSLKDYLNLSDEYWNGLSERDRQLYETIRPMPSSSYEADIHLHYLPTWLKDQERDCIDMGGSFELCPDFQRGHVWTEEQRVAFVEAFLGNRAEARIRFNAPNYSGRGSKGDLPENSMQCVDGLQRLTTLSDFVADKIRVFGGLRASDLDGTSFSVKRYRLKVFIHEFANRAELLSFYLDINAGGTVHSELRTRARAPRAGAGRGAAAATQALRIAGLEAVPSP